MFRRAANPEADCNTAHARARSSHASAARRASASLTMGKKKSPSAMIDDELILKCKHWKVDMQFPEKKEKPDAAAARQQRVRALIETAEKAYAIKLKEPFDAMREWFYMPAPGQPKVPPPKEQVIVAMMEEVVEE